MKFGSMKCYAVGVVLGFWTLTPFQNFCPPNTFNLEAYYINEYWKKVGGGPAWFCRVGYRCWRCGICFDKCVMICLLHWNLSSVLRKVSKLSASCFERQSFLKISWAPPPPKKKEVWLLYQKNILKAHKHICVCVCIYESLRTMYYGYF